jgi:hypothetical protein
MTRALFAILASLILVGCGKYNATNEFYKKPNSKAFVDTFDGGYGFSGVKFPQNLLSWVHFMNVKKLIF